MDNTDGRYDVVVIGGGAAGLSGGRTLARARRSVLVIDAGSPRNRFAEGVHNLLGSEGISPAVLVERGREELTRYGGEIRSGEVVDIRREDAAFLVQLADGGTVRARRILVTSGLTDRLPAVRGIADRWGRDVVHCPYCHGWEIRDRRIVVLGLDAMAVHRAQLFRQWSAHITLLLSATVTPTPVEVEAMTARGIEVVVGTADALEIADDRLVGVRTASGDVLPADAFAVATRMMAQAGFLASLGLEPVEHPSGAGVHVPVDAMGRTAVPGVSAAGNVADPMAQVGSAAAAATFAAAALNADLIDEDIDDAVRHRRDDDGADGLTR